MILEFRIKNGFIFSEPIEMSLIANAKDTRLQSNMFRIAGYNVLKSIGIYGPNNVGKTCFIKCFKAMQQIMLNQAFVLSSNIFQENPVVSMGITFLEQEKKYSFDFQYDTKAKEFLYERFSIFEGDAQNEIEKELLLRDCIHENYYNENSQVNLLLPMLSRNNLTIYQLNVDSLEGLKQIKQIMTSFAARIDIVDMNNIPISRTIEVLKNKNSMKEKIVNFIKNADLDLENILYADDEELKEQLKPEGGSPEEVVLQMPDRMLDQVRLTSVYHGIAVPSLIFDSTGTKKIAALASYMIEALEKGRILIIDELDSSFHFKLTRAIVTMFNNELNINAQLIFSVHDINLMDCRKLFRKEQIWFVHKDEEGVYLYSLLDMLEQEEEHEDGEVMERYRRGALGALPDPDMVYTLLEVRNGEKTS